jgi:hypothetical protein
MVWLPGGEFAMGSPNDSAGLAETPHRMRVSGFWAAKARVIESRAERACGALSQERRADLENQIFSDTRGVATFDARAAPGACILRHAITSSRRSDGVG